MPELNQNRDATLDEIAEFEQRVQEEFRLLMQDIHFLAVRPGERTIAVGVLDDIAYYVHMCRDFMRTDLDGQRRATDAAAFRAWLAHGQRNDGDDPRAPNAARETHPTLAGGEQ